MKYYLQNLVDLGGLFILRSIALMPMLETEKNRLKVGTEEMLLKNLSPDLPDRLTVGHMPLEHII